MSALFRPNVVRTRRSLWFRLHRLARLAFLRFELDSIEAWIADCARDGILESRSLQHCADRAQELRVLIAVTEAS